MPVLPADTEILPQRYLGATLRMRKSNDQSFRATADWLVGGGALLHCLQGLALNKWGEQVGSWERASTETGQERESGRIRRELAGFAISPRPQSFC